MTAARHFSESVLLTSMAEALYSLTVLLLSCSVICFMPKNWFSKAGMVQARHKQAQTVTKEHPGHST